MKSVSEFVSTFGHQRIASALGVGPTSVSNFKRTGLIPARKWLLVEALCQSAGVDMLPRACFTFDVEDGVVPVAEGSAVEEQGAAG